MGFPETLILSGPILRRVDPTLVSVQVVTQKKCAVQLSLWDGLVTDDSPSRLFSPPPIITSEAETTRRIGDKLHVAVVMLKLPPANQLQPGRLYSYNITLQIDQERHDLKSEKLLEDATESATQKAHLALGYAKNRLPSFSLPPNELTSLRIAHGSCRRINQPLDDGLAWVDELIKARLEDPNKRLHHLLLTGDQIYADDVPLSLLPQLLERGKELLGKVEFLPTINPEDVNKTLFWPADAAHFPPGMRQQLILSEARFSTVDHKSHLISLGEFAAMYLFNWCNALWSLDELKDFDQTIGDFALTADGIPTIPENWFPIFKRKTFVAPSSDGVVKVTDPEEIEIGNARLEKFVHFFFHELSKNDLPVPEMRRLKLKAALKPAESDNDPKPLDPKFLTHTNLQALPADEHKRFPEIYTFAQSLPENDQFEFRLFFQQLQSSFGGLYKTRKDDDPKNPSNGKEQVRRFYRTLPQVRRALANAPTLMMFDDHEVTDDWNLNPLWRDRVLTSPLGLTVMRNGMLAYALFQGWGNDPEKFKQGNHKKLLDLAEQYIAKSDVEDQKRIAIEIDHLFGLDQPSQADNKEQLSWHYSLRGPKYLLLGLDCRTRRSFATRYGPPGNISDSALKEQIPDKPPDGVEVTLAIVSLPVFAPQFFDEVVAPAAYRVFDAVSYIKHGNAEIKGMPGTAPDAIEGWANDPERFEALLKRLEPFRRVVLLSGDVHYNSTQQLSYWKKGDTEPARFVQCVSSGMRNILPGYLHFLDRRFARLQRLTSAKIGNERLGWNKGGDTLVELPAGTRVTPALKSRLRQSPALLPTTGWPEGAKIKTPPDWTWRAAAVKDERSDQERPDAMKPDPPLTVQDAALQTADALKAYREVVRRHAGQLRKGKSKHGRVVQFANSVGVVRFEEKTHAGQSGKFLYVIHDLLTVFSSTETSSSVLFVASEDSKNVFTRHEAVLTAPAGAKLDEKPPDISANIQV
jgi:hypothetical protein